MKYQKISISRDVTAVPEDIAGVLIVTTASFLADPFNPVMVEFKPNKSSRFDKKGNYSGGKPNNSYRVYTNLKGKFPTKEEQLTEKEIQQAYQYICGGPSPSIDPLAVMYMPYPAKVHKNLIHGIVLDLPAIRDLPKTPIQGQVVEGEAGENSIQVVFITSRAKLTEDPNHLSKVDARVLFPNVGLVPKKDLEKATVDGPYFLVRQPHFVNKEDLEKDVVPIYTRDGRIKEEPKKKGQNKQADSDLEYDL